MKTPEIKISVDDGSRLDVRTSKLLSDYGFTGIFYIPNKCELSILEIKEISKNHEIGGHTVTHPMDMKILDDNELQWQIEHNKKTLEHIIGRSITSFCYPRGRYDDRTIEALKKAGYTNARTTVVLNTDKPDDMFKIKTSFHIYPDRVEYDGEYWLDVAKVITDLSFNKGGYLHIWLHSWEIDKYNLWEEFEQLLKYINEKRK